jgi:hypothetical protein
MTSEYWLAPQMAPLQCPHCHEHISCNVQAKLSAVPAPIRPSQTPARSEVPAPIRPSQAPAATSSSSVPSKDRPVQMGWDGKVLKAPLPVGILPKRPRKRALKSPSPKKEAWIEDEDAEEQAPMELLEEEVEEEEALIGDEEEPAAWSEEELRRWVPPQEPAWIKRLRG